MQFQVVDQDLDGMHSRHLEFSGQDFKGKRYPGGNWVLREETPADATLQFYHRYQADLFMDFAAFKGPELLKDYTEASLRDYVLALKSRSIREGLKVEDARAVKAPVGSMPFMGGGYWKISYKLLDAETDDLLRKVSEYVGVDDNKKNYRLRFSGPPEPFDKFSGSFEAELSRFLLD